MFIKLHLFYSDAEIYVCLNDVANVMQGYDEDGDNETYVYMKNGKSWTVRESAEDVVTALEEGWQKFASLIRKN